MPINTELAWKQCRLKGEALHPTIMARQTKSGRARFVHGSLT